MEYQNINYMIFNASELGTIDFEQVLETSADTVRKSVDGTKTFVKWIEDVVPSSVEALTTKEGPYNSEEMLAILTAEEWSDLTPLP